MKIMIKYNIVIKQKQFICYKLIVLELESK